MVCVREWTCDQFRPSALQALGQVYKFDIASFDRKINFIPRGGNSVAIITEDDMVEDDQDIEETKRSDAIQIPRDLHLNYHDIDSDGLSSSKQTSQRHGDRRAVGEMSLQSAVVMDSNLAKQTAVIAHKVMIEDQKGQLRFGLPDNFIGLVPSDPIIVPVNDQNQRARVHEVEILDGYQRYICIRDRQSAFTSNVEGIPPTPVPTPPSQVRGPTAIAVLDIPLLRDADDTTGMAYYVAISGISDGWQGATVEISYDGGADYPDSRTGSFASVMGVLTSPLPDHAAEYPDLTNTFTLALYNADSEIEDTNLAGMLNRTNLAAVGNHTDGWELINFADVVQDSGGEWTVSNLLRGRRGTEPRAHAANSLFVLLNRSLLGFEPSSVAAIGQTLTFRATSSGQTTDTGTVVSIVYQGNIQRERKPGYLVVTPSGANLNVSWQGVGRLAGGATAIHGNFFTGYRVTLDDGASQIVVNTTDHEITQDVSALSAPITVSVQQVNSLTGPGPSIEVIV